MQTLLTRLQNLSLISGAGEEFKRAGGYPPALFYVKGNWDVFGVERNEKVHR